jgi:hypothetical protein
VPALLRCVSSFQPSEPNEPLRISASEGALDTVVPVAAHIPGGGLASINLMLAVRILLDVVEALVDVLLRRVFEGESGGLEPESGLRTPGGCGNGTGVDIEFGVAMFASERLCLRNARLLCECWPIPGLRV